MEYIQLAPNLVPTGNVRPGLTPIQGGLLWTAAWLPMSFISHIVRARTTWQHHHQIISILMPPLLLSIPEIAKSPSWRAPSRKDPKEFFPFHCIPLLLRCPFISG